MRIEAKAEIVWHYAKPRGRGHSRALEVDNANLPDGLKKSLNVITDGKMGGTS